MRFEKLNNKKKLEFMFDLMNAFSKLKTPVEAAYFLEDILTKKEIRNLSVRLRIARLLLAGKTFEEIQAHTKASSATITKVSLWIERGGEGFKNVILKLPAKWAMPKKLPKKPIEFQLPQAILATVQYGLARSQDKKITKFTEGVESKDILDRHLRQLNKETYKKYKKK